MSSIITTGQILDLLRPGLDQIRSDYDRYRGLYNQVYTTYNSFMHEEIDIDMKGTGYAMEKKEGGQIEIDNVSTTFKYPFVHKNFGLGIEITEEAVQDNLYLPQFSNGTKSLITSYEQTKELMAMSPFNNAFNSNVKLGDGVQLISANHPIYAGGKFSNAIGNMAGVSDADLTAVDLSELGLEQAVASAQRMKDQAGLLVAGSVEALLVPPEAQFTGFRLTESIGRVGVANNDINAIRGMNLIPGGIIVNPYLTSPGRWFALTNIKDTRKHFIRTKFNITMTTDPKTRTLSVLGNGRYSFGMFTPLGVLGARTAV